VHRKRERDLQIACATELQIECATQQQNYPCAETVFPNSLKRWERRDVDKRVEK